MKVSDNHYIIMGIVFVLGMSYLLYANSQPKALLIDSFEGKLNRDTVDYGSSRGSGLKVAPSKKLSKCGFQSIELTYNLKDSGYVYCARGYDLHHTTDSSSWGAGKSGWKVAPDQIEWDDYDGLSVYIHGGLDRKIAIDVKDAGGEMFRFLFRQKKDGWQKIVMPFEKFQAREDWQPDDARLDFILDFPIQSFQFEPKTLGRGKLNFDCMRLVEINSTL